MTSPRCSDPELKEAYDAFAAASEEMNTFQDGYNESMPVLLRSLGVCIKIFSVEVKDDELIAIPGVFADQWIKAHNKAAAPCLKLLDDLDQSTNYRIRQYAANYRKVIDQRNALMTDQGEGRIGFDQTVDRLERINKAFTKRNAQLTNFSDELAKLSSADEYLALDAIFEEHLARRSLRAPSLPDADPARHLAVTDRIALLQGLCPRSADHRDVERVVLAGGVRRVLGEHPDVVGVVGAWRGARAAERQTATDGRHHRSPKRAVRIQIGTGRGDRISGDAGTHVQIGPGARRCRDARCHRTGPGSRCGWR